MSLRRALAQIEHALAAASRSLRRRASNQPIARPLPPQG